MFIPWLIRKHKPETIALPESVFFLLLFPMPTRRLSLPGNCDEYTENWHVSHISYALYLRSGLTLRGWRQIKSRVGGVAVTSTTSLFVIVRGPSIGGHVAKNMKKVWLSHRFLHRSLGFVIVCR